MTKVDQKIAQTIQLHHCSVLYYPLFGYTYLVIQRGTMTLEWKVVYLLILFYIFHQADKLSIRVCAPL